MKKQEKKEYLNMDSIGYISALSGVEIKKVEYGIENYIIAVSGAWCSNKSVHRVKLNYRENDTTFRLYGYTLSMNDAIGM